jgi:hypothetical protein
MLKQSRNQPKQKTHLKKLLVFTFMLVSLGVLLAREPNTRHFFFGNISPKEIISKKWMIARAVSDGNDVTSDYDHYFLAFTAEGTVSLSAKFRKARTMQSVQSTGQWFFLNNQKKLLLDFKNNESDAVFTIAKLKGDEIRLQKDDEPLELYLIPH